ncbi:MAG: hypothetical protein JWL85_851 [Candidatus Saccharibacteria bacterium]|nr:hypothetical protein [Candidatus Saccharibacteria bacterium]
MRTVGDCYRHDDIAFEQVVQAAQDQIDIHFDEAPRQISINRLQDVRSVAGQDMPGLLDMEIREAGHEPDAEKDLAGLHHYDSSQPYDLRGLLGNATGYIDIHVASEVAGPKYPGGIDQRVRVSVLSSAKAINGVQEQLGRNPGEDAIKLTTTPEKTLYTPGEWLESFGDSLELGISDTSEWITAEHDREPHGHVKSWIATPAGILMQAATRAREIKAMYGEKIHLKQERPSEVGKFADGLENLDVYTHEPMAMMLGLGYKRLPKPPLHYVYNWVNARPLQYAQIFQNLGVIPADRTHEETIRAQQDVNKLFILHIARLCLRLDEIKPNEEVPQKTQAARTKMLQLVVEKYDLAA